MSPEQTLSDLMAVALAAADPYQATLKNLPERPNGKLFVLAAGKAATRMAEAAAAHYGAKHEGILQAPKGYVRKVHGFTAFDGDHPVPSARNVSVTKGIIKKVEALGEDDLFLALISGGTSALLCAPKGVTLAQKEVETRKLLMSGKPVNEINKWRRAHSAVKGGKLGEMAAPAKVVTLLVSDVATDDPTVIGSAPTGGGKIILKSADVLAAVKDAALKQGISVSDLGQVEGEAREAARDHADIALGYYGKRPHLILSGGETSVTVTGEGQGGRNSEYALALAIALNGAQGIYGLSIDTDGIDGANPFAGAMIKPDTLARAKRQGIDPEKVLKNNDSGKLFEILDDAVNPGPTFTNVNDLRMILLV